MSLGVQLLSNDNLFVSQGVLSYLTVESTVVLGAISPPCATLLSYKLLD